MAPLLPGRLRRPGGLTYRRNFTQPAYVTGFAVSVGNFGDLYVSGQTQGALVAPLIGNRDMFIAPLTTSGGSIMQ